MTGLKCMWISEAADGRSKNLAATAWIPEILCCHTLASLIPVNHGLNQPADLSAVADDARHFLVKILLIQVDTSSAVTDWITIAAAVCSVNLSIIVSHRILNLVKKLLRSVRGRWQHVCVVDGSDEMICVVFVCVCVCSPVNTQHNLRGMTPTSGWMHSWKLLVVLRDKWGHFQY